MPDHSLAGDGFPLLPEELRMLRETVRRFMREEVRPLDEAQPHDAFALPAADLLGGKRVENAAPVQAPEKQATEVRVEAEPAVVDDTPLV